jgi:hypothetical protein
VRRRLSVPLFAAGLAFGGLSPSTFRIEPDALLALHRLWAASVETRTEQVACLASTIEGDTVRITRIEPLAERGIDSLAVLAQSSLETCTPPAWQGTVHTHIALRDGLRPYSKFSGADRGVMLTWGQRWKTQGTFCLLYSDANIHCELDGPAGSLIFPSSTY